MADVEISYKGNTIASMSDSGTKTLLTEGKYCEDDITIEYTSPGGGGGTLITKTITANGTYDAEDDNADGYSTVTAAVPNAFSIEDEANEYGTTAVITAGAGTEHVIHLEFADTTDTDINVYYDDALLTAMITSYTPVTYGGKTVTLAQLDGVTWYEPSVIPIGVQLIDYNEVLTDKAIDSDGSEMVQQWYFASDFTPCESGMTFSFRAAYWFYLAFYDSSKNFISSIYMPNASTQDPDDGNTGFGTLSGASIPAAAAYIRMSGTWYDADHMSLIRTA